MKLLDELNDQRLDKCLCDVTLRAGLEDFSAHRNVLAAASPVFKAMFCGNFKEQDESFVDLSQSVSSSALQVLLDYIYTTRLCVTVANVTEVVSAADFLQIVPARQHCEGYMREHARTVGCVQFFQTACLLGMEEIANMTKQYIEQNFLDVFVADGFEALDVTTFTEIVSSDYLRTHGKEVEVFRVVCAWAITKGLKKKEVDSILTRCVHYRCIPKKELLQEVMSHRLFNTKSRMRLAEDALGFHDQLYKQPNLLLQTGTKLRGIRCVAGITLKPIRNRTARPRLFLQEIINEKTDTTGHYLCKDVKFSVALEPRSVQCVAHSRSFIFALGENAKTESCVLLRYSLQKGTWLRLKPPPFDSPLWYFMVTSSGPFLYVMGGTDRKGRRVDCCFRYVIDENRWEVMPRMPHKLSSSGICGHSNGNVYIAGGYETALLNTRRVKTLYLLETQSKVWFEESPMNVERAGFSLVEVRGDLYALYGARVEVPQQGAQEKRNHIERYSVSANQWTVVEVAHRGLMHMRVPDRGSSCAIGNDLILSCARLACQQEDNLYLFEWLVGTPFKLNKASVMKLCLDCDVFGVVTAPM